MPLSTDDFARLALHAADALASKGTPLVESVDKLASANDMNIEQIKRLCEATNNAAFKALFDKTASDDREVTFDVAKVEDVIGRRRSDGGAEKNASAPFDLSRELAPLASRHDGVEKIASKPYIDPLEERAREKTTAAHAVAQASSAQRMRDHLESVEETERYKFASDVDAIARYFGKLPDGHAHVEFVEVEKIAASTYGEGAMPLFAAVRKRIGLPEIEHDGLLKSASFHPGTLSSSPISLHIHGACTSFERARSARVILDTPGCIEAAIASAAAPAS